MIGMYYRNILNYINIIKQQLIKRYNERHQRKVNVHFKNTYLK